MWKKLPYWIKGGVIGGGIFVLFILILVLLGTRCYITPDQVIPCWVNLTLLLKVSFIQNPIILFISFLIIGAIIGFIYEKIKNKK